MRTLSVTVGIQYVGLPVSQKLRSCLRVCLKVILELKVLLEGQVAPIHDQVSERDLAVILAKLGQTGWLLEAELLSEDLHRDDIEEAPLHIEAYEEIHHIVGDI